MMKLGKEVLSNDEKKGKQGYVDLKKKTVEEIEELIERQDKLLQNRFFVSKLPDKGEKIKVFKNVLQAELSKREEELKSACNLFSKLSLIESTCEDLEWNEGKVEEKPQALDSDDDSDVESDPLKLLANHSGTAGGKKKVIDRSGNGYVEKFCEKYGRAQQTKERFKPNQLKNNDKSVFAVSAEKVKKRLGEKWEVTEATPPVPLYKDAVAIPLAESLKLQREQAQKLKELEIKNASERLLKKASLKMGGELPVKNITQYRTPSSHFEETAAEEETHEVFDPETEDHGASVCYTVSSYHSDS